MKTKVLFVLGLVLLSSGISFSQINSPSWTVNPAAFSFDMEAIVKVRLSGTDITSGGILGAFSGSTCVGVVSTGLTGPAGYVFSLRIYSNTASGSITFKFYHTVRDRVYEITETAAFSPDAQQGSALAPVLITCIPQTEAGLINLLAGGVPVYGFTPSVTTYSVVLPFGSTSAPTVVPVSIDPWATTEVVAATALPGTTNVIVTAEDRVTQRTYQISFTVGLNSNAALSDLKIDGTTLEGFSPYVLTYSKILPLGSTTVPQITATAADANATLSVFQASAIPGTALVQVTAHDGVTRLSYTIQFSTELSHDATLSGILIDGTLLSGFRSEVPGYARILEFGTTVIPVISATTAFPSASVTILQATTLPGTATLQVTAQDGIARMIYTVRFLVSKNSALASLRVSDVQIPGFSRDRMQYTYAVPYANLSVPVVTAIPEDPEAKITIHPADRVPGRTVVIVMARDSLSSKAYYVDFIPGLNTDASLTLLMVNGMQIAGFQPDKYQYHYGVPSGQASVPVVTVMPTDSRAKVQVTPAAGIPGVTMIQITAENGTSEQWYTVLFAYQSNNANLRSVSINGVPYAGFNPSYTYYYIALNLDTRTEPVFSFVPASNLSTVAIIKNITPTSDNWLKKIIYTVRVVAEDGTTKTYTFEVSYPLTGVNPVELAGGMVLSPNPSDGNVRLHYLSSQTGTVEVSVFSLDGRLVHCHLFEKGAEALSTEIHLEEQVPGLYVVRLVCGNRVETQKLVVR